MIRLRPPRRPVIVALALTAGLVPGWLPARAAAPAAAGRPATARPPVTRHEPLLGAPLAPPPPTAAAGDAGTVPPGAPKPFNGDRLGVPQNEETVTSCRTRPDVILGAENDYRGLVPPALGGTAPDFAGWQLSLDGGATVAKEGALPAVSVGNAEVPSDGDPVVAAAPDCSLYFGALDLAANETNPSAISVSRSTPETLAACPGGIDPSCWPASRVVASSATAAVIEDKPWLDVGPSGGEVVVWVAWTEFREVGSGPDYTSSIKAARCDNALSACTAPILISGGAPAADFADVTIGLDGRTYLSWIDVQSSPSGAETFVTMLRIAPAGSTTFGPPRVVAAERHPIGTNGLLHADDFRIETYPKNAVAVVAGRPRIFVTWESCRAIVDGVTCEEPRIRLRYSDDDGASWKEAPTVSAGGDNYFVTIDADPDTGRLGIAYYTNRADPFHHRQQVELVTVDAGTGAVVRRQTLSPLNEPDADPHLQGVFIGDYFEVSVDHGRALVHFNANYRLEQFVGRGLPVPQQDNYLVVAGL